MARRGGHVYSSLQLLVAFVVLLGVSEARRELQQGTCRIAMVSKHCICHKHSHLATFSLLMRYTSLLARVVAAFTSIGPFSPQLQFECNVRQAAEHKRAMYTAFAYTFRSVHISSVSELLLEFFRVRIYRDGGLRLVGYVAASLDFYGYASFHCAQ